MAFWQAFGRGLIKLLVCLLGGFGVAFYFIAKSQRESPELWHRPGGTPPGLFEGVAFGFLTGAGLLFLLFVVPSMWRKSPPPVDRSPWIKE
jgi:hypothetical protein